MASRRGCVAHVEASMTSANRVLKLVLGIALDATCSVPCAFDERHLPVNPHRGLALHNGRSVMRRYMCSLIKVFAVLSVLAAASVAWAQGVTGSAVTGTITEEGTGAPVAAAIIQ